MNKYELAKLIEMSGGFDSRKRIQKTVFLLQAAGCDFELRFCLHHYGPYSFELARLLNEMTAAGILDEVVRSTGSTNRYTYDVDGEVLASLHDYEKTERGKAAKSKLQKFKKQLKHLTDTSDLWVLELGSTIAYFQNKGRNWKQAVSDACRFKNVPPDSPSTEHALTLAKSLAT